MTEPQGRLLGGASVSRQLERPMRRRGGKGWGCAKEGVRGCYVVLGVVGSQAGFEAGSH